MYNYGMGYGLGYRDGQKTCFTPYSSAYGNYGSVYGTEDLYTRMMRKYMLYGMGYGIGYRDGQASCYGAGGTGDYWRQRQDSTTDIWVG